jgi:amino acid adenylation domain-containing protein
LTPDSVANLAARTLNDRMASIAESEPERAAFTFLSADAQGESHWSYGKLHSEAMRVAGWLREVGAIGKPVLLLLPTGLDYLAAFFGCLYAGAVAVPAYPPRRREKLNRLREMINDCQATFVLTNRNIRSHVANYGEPIADLQNLNWLVLEDCVLETAAAWRNTSIAEGDIAFLQYTSGSTCRPKGVAVSHANLMAMQQMIQIAMKHSSKTVVASWLPPYHDMGLIGDILQPIYVGGRCVLMAPQSFLQRPIAWLEAISRFRATTSGAPNFAYDLCASKCSLEAISKLDLSCWTVAYNGSEPISAAVLDRFAEKFSSSGFRRESLYPCYGLAEATLMVASSAVGQAPLTRVIDGDAVERQQRVVTFDRVGRKTTIVSSGRPVAGQLVKIVDPEKLTLCDPESVGEIWVSGPNVVQSYWGKEQLSQTTLRASLAVDDGMRYLRTGDLGVLLEGELFVMGRLKDLIILRGRNYHPQDIEATVRESCGLVAPGSVAAFAIVESGEEQLAVAVEAKRQLRTDTEIQTLIEHVRTAIARDHDIVPFAVAVVAPGGIPKTTSGKLQRKACSELFNEGRLELRSVWRRTNCHPEASSADDGRTPGSWLVQRIEQLTGVFVDLETPVNRLALDSMMVVELIHEAENRYGRVIPISRFWSDVPLRGLLEADSNVDDVLPTLKASPCDRVPDPEAHPLSEGQQALLFLQRWEPEATTYQISRVFKIRGSLEPGALRDVFQTLINRHAALRRHHYSDDRRSAQLAHNAAVDFTDEDVNGLSGSEIQERVRQARQRPFSLDTELPFRVHLFRSSPDEHLLLLVWHHIAVDLWSLSIVMSDFLIICRQRFENSRESLQRLDASYAEFVRWQQDYLAGDEVKESARYWRETLSTAPPALELPGRRDRSSRGAAKAGELRFAISSTETAQVRDTARRLEVTPYCFLLSSFYVLLHRYTGEDDLVVGSPFLARPAAFASTVGYFTNTLPLRAKLSGGDTFSELTRRVTRVIQAALTHQNYPLSLIVRDVNHSRDARPALPFEVMFVFQQAPPASDGRITELAMQTEAGSQSFGELTLETLPQELEAAEADLVLRVGQVHGRLNVIFEYNADRFAQATIAEMAAGFRTLLTGAISNPEVAIGAIPILSPDGRQHLLEEFNHTRFDYPAGQTLVSLLHSQVRDTPQHVALQWTNESSSSIRSMTYEQLHRSSNRLARMLRDRWDVGPNVVVGLSVSRSWQMAVAICGILKAGGAYLPIDITCPPERARGMLEDSQCRLLLTDQESTAATMSDGAVSVVHLDSLDLCADEDAGELEPVNSPSDLAYVIFTSGSSGRPKGVMIEHRGIVNRLLWMKAHHRIDQTEILLQKTTYTFDVSVWELLLPLISGARLHLLPAGAEHDPEDLAKCMVAFDVTTVHFVPSMFAAFLQNLGPETKFPQLRRCICSGEALGLAHKDLFFEKIGGSVALFNFYGPTEASIDVTEYEVLPTDEQIPIGKPVANTRAYILGVDGEPVPRGVRGELCLAGVQLARGYINQPELTASRLVENRIDSSGWIYRTGDLARWLEDGNIEYLGRLDNQVKIRGFRVELGEIELQLSRCDSIASAAVVAPADQSGQRKLIAYLTSSIQPPPPVSQIIAFLKRHLPSYMIPSRFDFLDALPLTSSGKLDRRSLPGIDQVRPALESPFVEPESEPEKALAAIFAKVLEIDRVGIHDDFFLLGGDSIRALQVVANAKAAKLSISIHDVFKFPTAGSLAQAARPSLNDALRGLPKSEDRVYPLSSVQQSLVFQSLRSPSYEVYVTSVHLRMQLDLQMLHRALEWVVSRHAFLRTSIDMESGAEPLQRVHGNVDVPIEDSDICHLATEDQETYLKDYLGVERRRRFALDIAPMLRLTVHRRSSQTWQLTFSDFSLDGWCVATVLSELLSTYTMLLRGGAVPPQRPLVASFEDFVQLERAALESEECQEFWDRQLAGASYRTLPNWAGPSRPSAGEGLHSRHVVQVASNLCDELRKVASGARVSLKSVLLAVHVRVLGFLLNEREVITGVEFNGRPETEDGDKVVGTFNNILPFRMTVADQSWLELVRQCHQKERDVIPWRRFPLVELQTRQRVDKLFDTVFVYTHFHIYKPLQSLPELQLLGSFATDQTFFPLTSHFNVDAFTQELELLLDFDPALLTSEQVKRIGEYYVQAMTALAIDPTAASDQRSLMSGEERELVLHGWNASRIEYERESCFHHVFERQTIASPDHVAVVAGTLRLTYAELNNQSNTLAWHLIKLGAGNETLVGLCLDRSEAMIIGLLAVLKSGAAFLPLDPTTPPERLRAMTGQKNIPLILAKSSAKNLLSDLDAQVVLLDEFLGQSDKCPNPNRCIAPDNAAYALYTSGSTGTPKRTIVPHRGLMNYAAWASRTYSIADGTGAPVHTSLSFDLTITSMLAPLIVGRTIELIPESCDVSLLRNVLAEPNDYSLVKLTPAHLALLDHAFSDGQPFYPPHALVIGGETLKSELIESWRRKAPSVSLFNEYGPTETVVGCCVYQVSQNDSHESIIPVGRPIANAQMYVLDGSLEPVPVGTVGEIYIGGDGVARGYDGAPDLTARSFIPDRHSLIGGGRLYRSGDLGCYLPDGNIRCLGRADHQVKIRGFRVEPGEIEAALETHASVHSAAVVLRTGAAGQKVLAAYVVPKPGFKIISAKLTEHLSPRLPDYMIPTSFMAMVRLPLSQNGKVDVTKLPEHQSNESKRRRLEALLEEVERLKPGEISTALSQQHANC